MATCKACSGKGSLRCPKCKGKGTYYDSGDLLSGGKTKRCENCYGSGVVRCGACGGRGQVK